MTDDARLTDFVGGDGAADSGESDAVDRDDAAGDADRADDADATEPPDDPAVTAEWTPDGAACEACDETVGRRWLDGDARVCADCKEW